MYEVSARFAALLIEEDVFFKHDIECRSITHLMVSFRLAAVHLVDSHLCANASQYISALLLSLNVMLSLEMPHINLLSKVDLIECQGELAFNLEFYSEVLPQAL